MPFPAGRLGPDGESHRAQSAAATPVGAAAADWTRQAPSGALPHLTDRARILEVSVCLPLTRSALFLDVRAPHPQLSRRGRDN